MSYYTEKKKASKYVDETVISLKENRQAASKRKLLYIMGLKYALSNKLMLEIITASCEAHGVDIEDDVINPQEGE